MCGSICPMSVTYQGTDWVITNTVHMPRVLSLESSTGDFLPQPCSGHAMHTPLPHARELCTMGAMEDVSLVGWWWDRCNHFSALPVECVTSLVW